MSKLARMKASALATAIIVSTVVTPVPAFACGSSPCDFVPNAQYESLTLEQYERMGGTIKVDAQEYFEKKFVHSTQCLGMDPETQGISGPYLKAGEGQGYVNEAMTEDEANAYVEQTQKEAVAQKYVGKTYDLSNPSVVAELTARYNKMNACKKGLGSKYLMKYSPMNGNTLQNFLDAKANCKKIGKFDSGASVSTNVFECKPGYKDGYISGYSDGTFRPNDKVTRAEFLVMINNLVKMDSNWYNMNSRYGCKDALPYDYNKGVMDGKWYKSLYETSDLFSDGLATACGYDGNFELMPISEFIQLVRTESAPSVRPAGLTDQQWQKYIDDMVIKYWTNPNVKLMYEDGYREYCKTGAGFNGDSYCAFLETPLDRMYFIKIIDQIVDLYEYDSINNGPTDACAQGNSLATPVTGNTVTRFGPVMAGGIAPENTCKPRIISAINAGIITKDKNGYAKLEEDMTRAECVALLNRVFYSGEQNKDVVPKANKFSDLNPKAWYYNDVLKAVKN